MTRRLLPFLLLTNTLCLANAAPDRHVVLVVWDGMRPDFISATATPNLWRLVERGVFFAHHHPVYLCATEVNGTAMATGDYPEHSGVIANTDFRTAIDPQHAIAIENPATVRRGDQVTHGHYLSGPTVAEILHGHGMTTVIAGAKQVALLHDRAPRADTDDVSPVLYEGEALPLRIKEQLLAEHGPFPPIAGDENKIDRDAWTTKALIDTLWKTSLPAYSLLWLAEPDASQHVSGLGSAQSLAAIASSDRNLGLVLSELERRKALDSTDVLVVSDHGFSAVSRKVDVAAELVSAGFNATRVAVGGLRPGQVIAIGNGGSSLLFVGGHDPAVVRQLAAYLQIQDWVGVVFSRTPLEGTFPLHEARIESVDAPDLVISLRWTRDKNDNGVSGLEMVDLSPSIKKMGNHASLSPFDMHNTLVAAGPDFRRGVTDTLPTSNTDLAPTILWCLGLDQETKQMDGRPLSEALTIKAPPLKSYELHRITAEHATSGGVWRQYLQVSEVNGVRYLDEGNGEWSKAE